MLPGDAFKKSVGNHSRFSICSALSPKAGESGARGTWGDPEDCSLRHDAKPSAWWLLERSLPQPAANRPGRAHRFFLVACKVRAHVSEYIFPHLDLVFPGIKSLHRHLPPLCCFGPNQFLPQFTHDFLSNLIFEEFDFCCRPKTP